MGHCIYCGHISSDTSYVCDECGGEVKVEVWVEEATE